MRCSTACLSGLLMSGLGGGCVQGSLATSTGPRPPGNRWSTARTQQVHVGEKVEFDFVLHDVWGRFVSPAGVADYCVAQIGAARKEAVPDEHGHFRLRYTFDEISAGEKVDVNVSAYRERGGRDYVEVGGQWFSTQTFSAEPDTLVARDGLRLTAYQSTVSFRLPAPPDDFDAATGVLRLRKPDGSASSVYVDRPTRPGFVLAGPEPTGYYEVHYPPRGDEVAATGQTNVTFTIYDVAGRRHVKQLELDTP